MRQNYSFHEALKVIKDLEHNVLYHNGKIDTTAFDECIRKHIEPKTYTRYLLWKCDVFVDVLGIALSVESVYQGEVKRSEVIEWLENFKEEHHQLV